MNKIFVAFLSFLAGITCFAEVSVSKLEQRIVRSAETYELVTTSRSGPIPAELLRSAQGILIFRQWGGGFWLGAKSGFGVVMSRQRDGRWGAPAFMKAIDGSFGPQIGGQRIDIVMLFMNRESLEGFRQGRFRVGVGAGAAVGPSGANAEGKVGAPILVYADNNGLYIGAAFEGGMLIPDEEANMVFYNREGITVPDIILGNRISAPRGADHLHRTLEYYEKNQVREYREPDRRREDDRRDDRRGSDRDEGAKASGDWDSGAGWGYRRGS